MLAIADYPETRNHPAYQLDLCASTSNKALRETSGFRFVGEKGVLHIADDRVRVIRHERPAEPGYAVSTFTAKMQEEYLREYRKKYPVVEPSVQAMHARLPPKSFSRRRDIATISTISRISLRRCAIARR